MAGHKWIRVTGLPSHQMYKSEGFTIPLVDKSEVYPSLRDGHPRFGRRGVQFSKRGTQISSRDTRVSGQGYPCFRDEVSKIQGEVP